METLTHLHLLPPPSSLSPEFRRRRLAKTPPSILAPPRLPFLGGIRVFSSSSVLRSRYRICSLFCRGKENSELEAVEEIERPPFDINLAVILAGFAFEAYTTVAMKGEKELVDKILQTEISIFLALRDGSAVMQHMEDFYYISLLEHVRSNYQIASMPVTREGESSSIG